MESLQLDCDMLYQEFASDLHLGFLKKKLMNYWEALMNVKLCKYIKIPDKNIYYKYVIY